MIEEIGIRFYSIEKCGYYKRGSLDSEFGSISDILLNLHDWITTQKLKLIDTCTYALKEDENNSLRTFCFNILKCPETGDFFITTWNEVPSSNNKVSSVAGNDFVGEAHVHENEIKPGTIPGYATYFWFICDLNIFTTIKFQKNQLNGHEPLKRYINGFMESCSKYAVKHYRDDDNIDILGYRDDKNSDPLQLNPFFKSSLLRKKLEIISLKTKRNKIVKIIRKKCLDLQFENDKTLADNILIYLGIRNATYENKLLQMKYDCNYTPTEEQLNDIIESSSTEKLSYENDYGFKFSGEEEIQWLGTSIVKRTESVDVKRVNEEIVTLESLSQSLKSRRQNIVTLIKEIQCS